MSVVFGCGFARVAVKESFHKPRSVAKVFKVSFAEAQTKVSELELQKKKTRLKKNANVDNAHAKKNKSLKKNGPNETQKRC